MSSKDRERRKPGSKVTRELYLYSGNQCAFPGCTEVLLQPDGNWNCEIAHIYGVQRGSARGNHSLTNDQLRESSNLLLLCPNHHSRIDNLELTGTYTVDAVRAIKSEHESKFKKALLGLDRIIDGTAGVVVKRPKNLCGLDGFCTNMNEEEILESVKFAAPFIEALAKQPAALRDVISLIMVHGKAENYWGSRRVFATVAKIEAVSSSITAQELSRRAKSLESDGLIEISEDEGTWNFVLVDPTASHVGWDLFVSIHDFAAGDAEVIRQIVDQLDFAILDLEY